MWLRLGTLSATLVLVTHGIAWACTCRPPAAVPDAFADSDLVVYGEVLSVREPLSLGCTVSTGDPMTVEIEVLQGLKGADAGEVVEVTTARGGATCGVGFQEGETWLVYGSNGSASLCSRTRQVDDDDPELEELLAL